MPSKNLNTSSGLENVKTTGAAQSLVSQCLLLWFVNPKSEWNVKYSKAKTLNTLLKCEAFWKALKKTLKCIWPEKGIILSEALQLLFQVWNLCNLSLNGLHDGDVLLLEGETSLQLLPKCEERNRPKEINRMCLSSALHKHSAIFAVFLSIGELKSYEHESLSWKTCMYTHMQQALNIHVFFFIKCKSSQENRWQ